MLHLWGLATANPGGSNDPSLVLAIALIAAAGSIAGGFFIYLEGRKRSKDTKEAVATDKALDGLSELVDQLQEELVSKRTEATNMNLEMHDCIERCRELTERARRWEAKAGKLEADNDNLQARVIGLQHEINQLRRSRGQ